jgi:AcrR family transcriptional regulator
MRRESTDPRSVETRRRLLDALTGLIREDGYSAATVTRITSVAGVSRGAFYEHFADVDEATLLVLDDLLATIGRLDTTARTVEGSAGRAIGEFALELVLDEIFANRDLYVHVLVAAEAPGTTLRVLQTFSHQVRAVMTTAHPEWPTERIEVLSMAIGGAMLSGIVHWLVVGESRSSHELAQELMLVVPTWLYPDPTRAAEPDQSTTEESTNGRRARTTNGDAGHGRTS